MLKNTPPVLIIGGSGVVGACAARALRRLHPDLPLAIGGRNLAKANAAAANIRGAVAVAINLDRADLGLTENSVFSAVAVFLKDETLNSMRYAQNHGIPYVSISSGTFEIGPEVALFVHGMDKAPILLASHWLAGSATIPTLHFAAEYRSIDSIHLSLLLDEEDMGGPAAYADYERITSSSTAALVLKKGQLVWVNDGEAKARITSVDGHVNDAHAYSPFDIISLAAATDAKTIRIDLAVADSASKRRGEPFSTEIVIEIEGQLKSGESARARHEIVHPDGQAPLTGLGVAIAVERLLGLAGGESVAPGLYLPEILIDPEYFVRRMQYFGARFDRR